MCGGDAALCQITLTTCLYLLKDVVCKITKNTEQHRWDNIPHFGAAIPTPLHQSGGNVVAYARLHLLCALVCQIYLDLDLDLDLDQ